MHELRHIYQIKNTKFNFDKYKTLSTGISTKEYNLQPEELDVNAFNNCFLEWVIISV